MARVEKNTVDYFPHLVSEGKKMFFIEQKYGNDGYATWWKILEKLATTDNHFLDLSEEQEIMYLSSKCKIKSDVLLSVINDLVKMGVFDKMLWNECKVIWSQAFVENIADAYVKRKNECITYEDLCVHLIAIGQLKPSKFHLEGGRNTQRKGNESKLEKKKEKEIKEEEIILSIPAWEDFHTYAKESYKGDIKLIEESLAYKYKSWADNGWRVIHNGKNYPIKNWKISLLNTLPHLKQKNGEPQKKESKIIGALRAGQAAINHFDNE
jgi:hypothetical protein